MSLVRADALSIAFGPRVVLEDASFAIQPGDRVGLLGPNGSGKTTLLRILAGEREPDDGEVQWTRGVRAGYLPQDILELPPGNLVDSVLAALPADLARFEADHGRHRAEEILQGLGFSAADMVRSVAELSGGWKMRAALAGLLLLDPDLLLLDEPTNHLDVPSLQWFDNFLRRSRKALFLVSHDRDFLNRQIGRVISLEVEGLRDWKGNVDAYRVQRQEEERNLELRARRQQAQRAETEAFIDRFRAKASKARQVQSRVKMLEKQAVVQVRETRAKVRFRFPEVPRSGREVLSVHGLGKSFGEKVIYRGLDARVLRGERVAIIGVNGAGKTTLLKLIAGELAPDAGRIEIGHGVIPSYFAQHHTEVLRPDRTILEEISELVPREPQSFVRGILGSFLFSGDEVDKPIGVLSGGEKARVSLARLLVVPSNLMLMDEPTNHLDLDSSERLVEALQGYGGTLVFVSHNRSFVNQLATKVWDVADAGITEWPGNLDDYLYHLDQIGKPMGGVPATVAPREGGAESPKERRAREARERAEKKARTRPLREEIRQLEASIAALESEQKELSGKLADPDFYGNFAEAQPVLQRYQAGKVELEERLARWEAAQEELASLPED